MCDVKIITERTIHTTNAASGATYIDGRYFCESLEDTARAYGVKVPNETCIPPGTYQVAVTRSARFNKDMIHLYTDETSMECRLGGVTFSGIRVHGGNTVHDTSGCILVAFDRVSATRIKRSASAVLFARVSTALALGERVLWVIRNNTPHTGGAYRKCH